MVGIEVCNDLNTLNITSIEIANKFAYSESEKLVYSIVIPVILIFGVTCNASFLFVVAKIKRLHTITNYYLACIAIADITFISTSITAYLWIFFTSPVRGDAAWDHDAGCVYAFALPLSMYFTSMFLITLVTLERYYAICYPLKHMGMASKRRTVKIIISTTLVSIVLGCLVSLKDDKVRFTCITWPTTDDDSFANFPPIINSCRSVKPVKPITIMSEVLQTLPFFVALIWNVFMYVRIIYTLNNRKITRTAESMKNQTNMNANRVRNQVARLLILNGVAFFVCQVCYRLFAIHNILKLTLGKGIFNSDEAVGLVVIISRGTLYLNSSINPVLYNLSSSFYYNAFKEAFGCKPRSRRLLGGTSVTVSSKLSTISKKPISTSTMSIMSKNSAGASTFSITSGNVSDNTI